jgi:hypothetical protein
VAVAIEYAGREAIDDAALERARESFGRLLLTGELSRLPGHVEDWAAWAPELLWPVWGVALALACLAYLGRRTA